MTDLNMLLSCFREKMPGGGGMCYAHANMQTDTSILICNTILYSYTLIVLLFQGPHQRHRHRAVHPADRGRRRRRVPHPGRRSQPHRHRGAAPQKISQGTLEDLCNPSQSFGQGQGLFCLNPRDFTLNFNPIILGAATGNGKN